MLNLIFNILFPTGERDIVWALVEYGWHIVENYGYSLKRHECTESNRSTHDVSVHDSPIRLEMQKMQARNMSSHYR